MNRPKSLNFVVVGLGFREVIYSLSQRQTVTRYFLINLSLSYLSFVFFMHSMYASSLVSVWFINDMVSGCAASRLY